MKKVLCLAVLLSLILSSVAFATESVNAGMVYDDDGIYLYSYEVIGNEIAITECDLGLDGDIVIPEKIEGKPVTVIKAFAFSTCFESEGTISLPSSVKTIEEAAFMGCEKLTEINVDPANPYYTSVGGVLYNKDKTVLVRCPEGKTGEYIIPDSVKSFEKRAFDYCQYLTSVVVPSSVKNFENFKLGDCYGIKTVCFKEGVRTLSTVFSSSMDLETLILPASFSDLLWENSHETFVNLKKIIYYGTEQKWNGIKSNFPEDVTVIYRCADAHAYDGEADITCNNCTHVKEIIPELVNKTTSSAELKTVEGYEYSIDCQNWQDSGVFTGLKEGDTYRFYSRPKSDIFGVSSSLIVTLEEKQSSTPTPTPTLEPSSVPNPDNTAESDSVESENRATESENSDTVLNEEINGELSSTVSDDVESNEKLINDGESDQSEQASGDGEISENDNTVWIVVVVVCVAVSVTAAAVVINKMLVKKQKDNK